MKWFTQLRALLSRRGLEADMAEEMRLHLELLMEQNRQAGMSPDEARNAALREFGNVASHQEKVREARGWLWLEGTWRDLRQAARALSGQPGLATVIVVTLTLGIGVNTAIFTVLNAVLLRPLAVVDESSLFVIQTAGPDGANDTGLSFLDFADLRRATHSFSGMGIVSASDVLLVSGGETVRATAAIVSPDIFTIAGLVPHLGRAFTTGEELPGAGVRPVMLTYRTWQSRFHGDPAAVGTKLIIDEVPCEIVGVTPPGLFPVKDEPVDLWLTPAQHGDPAVAGSANASRSYRPYVGALARLRPGVTPEQARAELKQLNAAIVQAQPDLDQRRTVRLTGLRTLLVGDYRTRLWLMLAVVGLVLLIACVNVANLLLARSIARQREFAIRRALGAGGFALLRQHLAETLLLALLGGGLGLLLAGWIVELANTLLPAGLPRMAELAPDWRVLAFALMATLGTGVLCGLLPAWAGHRTDPAAAMKDGGRSGSGGRRHDRLREVLAVAQVALALVLLVGSGLLLRSLARLQQVNPGYRTERVLTAQVTLSGGNYFRPDFDPRPINIFLDRLETDLRALPGVEEVAFAQCVPLTENENNTSYLVRELPPAAGTKPVAQLRFVSAGYFELLSIPLRAGRLIDRRDQPDGPAVALVNEAFVQQELHGETPLGRHIQLGWGGEAPKEIVGVVGDVRHRGLGDGARPEIYVPQSQFGNAGITILIRTVQDPAALGEAVRHVAQKLDPSLPVTKIIPLDSYRSQTLSGPRFASFLLGLFAATALVLTLVGIYGTMSHGVTSRTREIAVRLALGADRPEVYRLILGRALGLTFAGIIAGLALSAATSRLLASFLYATSAIDLPVYGALALVVLALALLATWLPARRAAKVDPVVALRAE